MLFKKKKPAPEVELTYHEVVRAIYQLLEYEDDQLKMAINADESTKVAEHFQKVTSIQDVLFKLEAENTKKKAKAMMGEVR